MKIQRRTSFFTRKRIFVALVIIVVIAGLAGAYWWFNHKSASTTANQPRPINSVDYGPATQQEQQDSAAAKQQAVNNNTGSSGTPTQSGAITVSISHAAQVNPNVSVRTIVTGATTGNCTMTFTLAGKSDVVKSFPISLQATSYVCNGDIPTSSFPSGGDWKLSVVATSGNDSSVAATQTVTITK